MDTLVTVPPVWGRATGRRALVTKKVRSRDNVRVTRDEFRQAALAFPEAAEQETWGHPTFRVRGKMFATMSADDDAATVKASKEAQSALVGSEPETFSIPAYVGQHGWVGIRLERVDAGEAAELLDEAWRATAPKRVVAAFDADE
jgi:hypothetical protein